MPELGELGRGVVVVSGAAPPEPWSDRPRVRIDEGVLDNPGPTAATLQQAWLDRRPVVVELAVDPKDLQERETSRRPVFELGTRFEFEREHLHFLVWANNYDARTGSPIWWHGRKAVRTLARWGFEEGGPADVVLGDGTPFYVDGGPFASPPLASGIEVIHRWNAEAGSRSPVGSRVPSAVLAEDQLAAVGHQNGGARVIAPAGSGKTRVLTERLRHLLEDRGVEASTVTALAYNAKAAEEMRNRCDGLLSSNGPHIRTLNSVGLWICNEFGEHGSLRVLEEPQARDLVQRTFEVRRQANADTVQPYLDGLSAIRLGLTSPTQVEEEIPDARGLAAGFDDYRRALSNNRAVDFDEQIYRSIEILVRDPDARSAAQSRCRHLLVDEFQDLNPAHMLLLRLLSAPSYACFGVGDDDQVIYGYSGATPEYLIKFSEYFPGAQDYALEVNYRCPPEVVGAARNLLSYNQVRIPKTITTPSDRPTDALCFGPPLGENQPVLVAGADAAGLPATAVSAISSWRAGGVALPDISVLSRVNSTLLPIQVALIEAGIPCSTPLGSQVLQRTGIATALAYLRLGLQPDRLRREDLVQTVRRPSRGIAPNVAAMLTERPETSIDGIRNLAGRLSGRDVPKLLDYADSIDAVAAATRTSTAAAVGAIRVDVGLGETMDVLDSSRREADRSTHADDLQALESLAALHPDAATFESWLRDLLKRGSPEGPAVHLSTVHKIKGREWPFVVIYGASKGLFPHRLSDDEEGERRVFHVALTRAIRQVLVLCDTDDPSPFVAELNGSRPHSPLGIERRRSTRFEGGPARMVAGGRQDAGRPRTGRRERTRRSVTMTDSSPRLAAEVGLVIEHGGHRGVVVEVGASGAVMKVDTARLRVPFGSEVRVDGTLVRLDAAGGADNDGKCEDALRRWRSEAAKRAEVPAYVVLNDKELVGIAEQRPTSLAELARCKGMGEIRLERWGDELLAVLADAEGEEPAS